MSEIVVFVPKAELDAQANLEGFIEFCRYRLTVFGKDLDFDANRWDVSETIELKAKYHAVRMVFSNLETSTKKNFVPMQEPYLSFAKGYMRNQHAFRPTDNIPGRLVALRALEAALREAGTADPVRVDSHILNRATQMLKDRLAPATAYRAGGQLELVSEFLCVNRLTSIRTIWHNPIPRPVDGVRVGKVFDDRRTAKLPSEAALSALPKVYRLATEPGDILVSSACAVLCSAPDRINELLLLPEKCEVRQQNGENGEHFGLRWWPAKGADPMVKWVVSSMSGIVQEAIERIRRLTDEARAVARWYEQNPTKIYLSAELQHLRAKEWLTLREVADILYVEAVEIKVAREWCKKNIAVAGPFRKNVAVRFADLEAAVLKWLPRGFPVMVDGIGLRYSEALFVILRNGIEVQKSSFRCIIEPVGQGLIWNRLGARDDQKSIFERAGFTEDDGSSIHVTTHQFRHYLNTLAQAGGLSQLDIAKWSGRKDIRQNEVYDHESNDSLLARVREAVGDDTRMFGPLAAASRKNLIPRDQFARLKVPTAHTTEFGYCIHDYVMAPCQMHRDCINCGEQVCIKGEVEKEGRTRLAFAEATRLLQMAEKAEEEGDFGASEWVEHHRVQMERLSSLMEILENPSVPSGAVIRLSPANVPSRLDHAVAARLGYEEQPKHTILGIQEVSQ